MLALTSIASSCSIKNDSKGLIRDTEQECLNAVQQSARDKILITALYRKGRCDTQ